MSLYYEYRKKKDSWHGKHIPRQAEPLATPEHPHGTNPEFSPSAGLDPGVEGETVAGMGQGSVPDGS